MHEDLIARLRSFTALDACDQHEIDTLRDAADALEALQADALRYREALVEARDTFHRYAVLHRAKGTPDADEKADANAALAAKMDAAIASGAPTKGADMSVSRDELKRALLEAIGDTGDGMPFDRITVAVKPNEIGYPATAELTFWRDGMPLFHTTESDIAGITGKLQFRVV